MNTDKILSVNIDLEAGFDSAMKGLSFNKKQPPNLMHKVAYRLAPKDYGHNKFLRQIWLWLDVRAPRYWWQEADTYMVATSKQSESTVHTVMKHELTEDDFCEGKIRKSLLLRLNWHVKNKDFRSLKQELPESFMQRRMFNINYATLRNMILQRESHILVEWQIFLYNILQQVEHPELLPGTESFLKDTIEKKLGDQNG